MAMIPLSPIIEKLLGSLGYEHLQMNGHHHQHSHAQHNLTPKPNAPVVVQHNDKPEILRSNRCNFFN